MSLRLLLSIWLAAAAVRAEATWAVDPGQALLTVDGPPFSAFSHRVTGRLLEQEDGAVRVELRMPLESLDGRRGGWVARAGGAAHHPGSRAAGPDHAGACALERHDLRSRHDRCPPARLRLPPSGRDAGRCAYRGGHRPEAGTRLGVIRVESPGREHRSSFDGSAGAATLLPDAPAAATRPPRALAVRRRARRPGEAGRAGPVWHGD